MLGIRLTEKIRQDTFTQSAKYTDLRSVQLFIACLLHREGAKPLLCCVVLTSGLRIYRKSK